MLHLNTNGRLREIDADLASALPSGLEYLSDPALSSVPDFLEVHLIDRPGQLFLGVGEAAQGPIAAAITNAVATLRARPRELALRAAAG